MPEIQTKVFISYSRKDLEFAERLRKRLRGFGFDAYLDKHDIAPGEDWKTRLNALIESADTIVFVISPDSVASQVCDWEVNWAERQAKRILPVVYRDSADVPERLNRLNYVFLRSESEEASEISKLVGAIETDIEWVRKHTRYGELAAEWDRAGRPARLLLRGSGIGEAEAWRDSRNATAPELTERHLSFLRESRRSAIRRQRLWVAGSLVIAGLATTLAIFAVIQRNEAQRQQLVATARSLASSASQELGETREDERAGLLARQAYLFDTRAGGESESLILTGLQRVLGTRFLSTKFDLPDAPLEALSDDLQWGVFRQAGKRYIGSVRFEPGTPPTSTIHASEIAGAIDCEFVPGTRQLVCLTAQGVQVRHYGTTAPAEPLTAATGTEPALLAISRNARKMLVALKDGQLVRFPLPLNQGVSTQGPVSHPVNSPLSALAVDADASNAVVAGEDGSIAVVRIDTGETLRTISLDEGYAKSLGFSTGGQWVAIGGHYGQVWSWNWAGRDAGLVALGTTPGSVDLLAFAPDGETFATASSASPSGVFFWNIAASAGPSERMPGPRGLAFLQYARGQAHLVAGTLGGEVRVIDLAPSRHAPHAVDAYRYQKTLHRPWIFDIALHPNEKELVVVGTHGLIQYFRDLPPTTPEVLAEHRKAAIRMRPAADAIVSGDYDWRQNGHVFSARFSPDGKRFATGDIYGNIHQWHTGGVATRPDIVDQSGNGIVWALAYSNNGDRLAASYDKGQIRLYDVDERSPRLVARFDAAKPENTIRRIVAGPGATNFLAAIDSQGVIFFELDGVNVRSEVILASDEPVLALARPLNSGDLVAASTGSTLWILNRTGANSSWRAVAVSRGIGTVMSAAWSTDGRRLAAGFEDGSVRVWALQSGAGGSLTLTDQPVVVEAVDGLVRAIALGTDGKFLLTGGDDGYLGFWPLDVHAAAESICGRVMRNLTREEWTSFVGTSIEYEPTCENLPPARIAR